MSRLDFIQHVDCSRNKTAVIPLRPGLFGEPDRKPRWEKRCGRQPCLWKITKRDRTCGNEKSSEITDSSVVSFPDFTAWLVSAQLPRNLTKIAPAVPWETSPIISDMSRTSIGDTPGLTLDVSSKAGDWICRRAMNIQKRARSFPSVRSALRRELKQWSLLVIRVLILNNWGVRCHRHSVRLTEHPEWATLRSSVANLKLLNVAFINRDCFLKTKVAADAECSNRMRPCSIPLWALIEGLGGRTYVIFHVVYRRCRTKAAVRGRLISSNLWNMHRRRRLHVGRYTVHHVRCNAPLRVNVTYRLPNVSKIQITRHSSSNDPS